METALNGACPACQASPDSPMRWTEVEITSEILPMTLPFFSKDLQLRGDNLQQTAAILRRSPTMVREDLVLSAVSLSLRRCSTPPPCQTEDKAYEFPGHL